jgi:hypothetical protein
MNWYLELKEARKGFWGGAGAAAAAGTAALFFGLNNPQAPNNPSSQESIQTKPEQAVTQKTQVPAIFDQPKPSKPANNNVNTNNVNTNNIVARVIFAEALNTQPKERFLVASTIKNRINNKAFGNFSTMQDIVTSGAFDAYNSKVNKNWDKSGNPNTMQPKELQVWKECLDLSSGDFKAATGPSGRPIVYYHDKSIRMPSGWNNKFWKAVKEIETEHFIFYSVIPNK